jgi:predicted MFS family arabinose efflux permease
MNQTLLPRTQERLILLILACIQFTHIVDFMIMMPMGDMMMQIFRIKPQEFSFLVASYTLSAGIVGFFAAFSIDRFDRQKALQVMYAGFIVGTFACSLAPNYYLLLLARTFTGAFGGVLGALILAVISDVIPAERRATAMGMVSASFAAASILGVPFGYYLAHRISWQAPFAFLAIAGLLISWAIFRFIPPMTSHLISRHIKRPSPLQILQNIGQDRNQLRALGFMMTMMLSHFTVVQFIAPYMQRNVGFREEEVTYIYFVGGLLTLVSAPIAGRLADRYGKPKVFVIFALLTMIPVWFITNMPQVSVYWALLVTSVFFITASGRMVPAQAMMAAVVPPQSRGSFMSINASVQHISTAFAAAIAGWIVVEQENGGKLLHYEIVGYFGIVVGLLMIWLGQGLKSGEKQQ